MTVAWLVDVSVAAWVASTDAWSAAPSAAGSAVCWVVG